MSLVAHAEVAGPGHRTHLLPTDLEQRCATVGTMSAVTVLPARAARPRLLTVGARVWTLHTALFWGLFFFGLIDLQVVVIQN
jgi:hypothetical protein